MMNLVSCSRMMRVVAWAAWIVAVSPGFAAGPLNLEKISPPADRSFPQGYEVVAEPTAGSSVIKQMPAGLAKVAAYLEAGGKRYYMTDWSYDRYRQGLSYNWIRPLGAGQSGGAVSSSSGGGSGYRITGVPVGETLNIRSGPGTNFAVAGELPNGKDGIQITGDAVMNGEAEWVPISYPGGKGWTRTKYLARSSGGGGSSVTSGTASSGSVNPSPSSSASSATGMAMKTDAVILQERSPMKGNMWFYLHPNESHINVYAPPNNVGVRLYIDKAVVFRKGRDFGFKVSARRGPGDEPAEVPARTKVSVVSLATEKPLRDLWVDITDGILPWTLTPSELDAGDLLILFEVANATE